MNDDHRSDGTTNEPTAADHAHVQHYEIRVRGHLGQRWATWFDGMEIAVAEDGTSVLRGPVVDQAALHGLLQRLRDVGIPLVSLTELASGAPTDGPTARHQKGHEA